MGLALCKNKVPNSGLVLTVGLLRASRCSALAAPPAAQAHVRQAE